VQSPLLSVVSVTRKMVEPNTGSVAVAPPPGREGAVGSGWTAVSVRNAKLGEGTNINHKKYRNTIVAPFISHVRGVGTVAELMPQDIVVSRAGEKLSDNLNRSHSFHQSIDDAFNSIIGSHRILMAC